MSGRKATTDIKPGQLALSVGKPNKAVPKGWNWVALTEVATMATGHTPSRRKPEYWGGNIPWISVRDARPFHGKTIYKTAENINPLGIKNSAAVLLPPGTVCLSRTGSIGYSILLGEEMATSQGFVNWICSDKLTPRFLQLLFVAENTFLHSISEGVAHTTIYFPEAKAFHICIPDVKKQLAIVSKIEELFSELDKGIEQLKTAQQQLKTYRQSVLKWAFEGKLTNEHIKDGELPEGWKQVQIKDVAETYGGYAFKSGEFKTEGKYQVLRMGNVRPGVLRYDESPVFLDRVDENVLSRSLLKINDVIITQTGTRKKRDYGFTVLIPKSNLLLNQRIAAIRFKEKYLPKLFLYFSWTDLFKDQFFANETGNVGQGNVGMKAVTETLIPFCSIDEQNKIVQEIESRLSVADKMDESITQSLQQAEALRQSILKKAFEGRLIN